MMERLLQRCLVRPEDVPPSRPDFKVTGTFNPGVVRWQDTTYLLIRVVETVAEQCAERAEQCGVEIVLILEGLPQETMLDADQIEHCLVNLMANGIEAMPHGGTLSVRAGVDGHDPAQEQTCVIEISDQGAGIPDSDLDRVFEPFYSSKGSKGTGIGLAVSNKIVAEHGGDLSVVSALGHGTTFTIALPIRGGQET